MFPRREFVYVLLGRERSTAGLCGSQISHHGVPIGPRFYPQVDGTIFPGIEQGVAVTVVNWACVPRTVVAVFTYQEP